MHRLVHFIHGKESGTSGGKIAALATVARSRQWNVASLNYSHTMHPTVRLEQLLRACADVRTALLLVDRAWWLGRGRSRGASRRLRRVPTRASRLQSNLCDARSTHAGGRTEIVHGWDDEVIQCENAIRFARLRQGTSYLMPGDHRLTTRIPVLCELFDALLLRCAAGRLVDDGG
jgi:hypothetical protein